MAREFFQTLPEIRGGELSDELTQVMKKVVGAVGNCNRPGSITLKIKFKPGSGGSIDISDEIKAVVPEFPRGSSLFFSTPENHLVRDNPRRNNLPGIRSIDNDTGEIKVLNHG